MQVFVDAETLEKLVQCIPDGDTYEDKFRQICDSFSQMYEVSADAIKVIDNLEESNAKLQATLAKTGSLSVASMKELKMQIQENEKLRQRLADATASPRISAPATPSTESAEPMKQLLDWIAEFFSCNVDELETIVPRVATEHKNYQDLINRVCEKLSCHEDEIEDVLDARPDVKKEIGCESDEDVHSRIELMKNCTGLVESLSQMLGVPAEDLHQTVVSLMSAPKAGTEVEELRKENERLQEQGRAVAAERDELLEKWNLRDAMDQHKKLAYDHYSNLFERFPIVTAGDVPPVSDESLWNMTYELRNAHESMREMQRVNDEEKKRIEGELMEARTDLVKEQTTRQALEAENVLLRSQLSSDKVNQQLKMVCEVLGCATEAEIQQKLTSMKTEILYLRSQKQVSALVGGEAAVSESSSEQIARLSSENTILKDELSNVKTELYKSQQEVESIRGSIERARHELMEKDQILSSERNQRREAEISRESAKSDLRLATKELEDVRSQCETVVTAANRISATVEQYSQKNRNAADLCKSLNLTFCQFALLEFSSDPSRELLKALTNSSFGKHSAPIDTSSMEDTIHQFGQRVTATLNDISRRSQALSSRIVSAERKFARLKETTLDVIDVLQEKKEELQHFMETDMAPLAMSLQMQLQKLQEAQQPQAMTPPRSQFNSRSSMSPSEVSLDAGQLRFKF